MMNKLAGILVAMLLVGCGGGGGTGGAPGSPPPSSSPPPPPPAPGIGSAGGTVTGPNGSQVVVPPGALSTSTQIAIEQESQSAPPLPAGVIPLGAIFAMTPHGTTFSVPAKVTLPFDSAALPAGTEPRIYKTNAAGGWELLAELGRDSGTTTAEVAGFSHFFVAPVPLPPLQRGVVERSWIFEEFHADGLEPTVVEQEDGLPNSQTGGVASDEHDFGQLPLAVNGDDRATGAVYSSEQGTTYWVLAQGPQGSIQTPASRIGNRVTLIQKQGFRKNSADARLKLHVTRVFVEAIDANGTEILYPECPWTLDCGLVISGSVVFDVRAYHYATFFSGRSRVELSGYQGHWVGRNQSLIDGRERLWGIDDFVIDGDVGGNGSKQHAKWALREPITIDIDLSRVQVGESFTLFIEAIADTMNRRQRESYVAAYFRDPLGIEGTSVETHGLEPVGVPVDDAPADERRAAECASGTDAEAGVLQFESADFLAPEVPTGGGQIQVTRTGGSRGEVSATIRSADGTAIAGSDYEAIESNVYFGDGDTAPRTISVPIVLDQVSEPDKSLTLMLEDPRGCAALGAIDSTRLTILDDDRPEAPEATYTVGGTLSGLEGSGLLLREVVTGAELSPANGAFRFDAEKPDGSRYEVRVATQPTQPLQVCTVTRGVGLVAGANISDVAVHCETPAPSGSLDPSFGHQGRVINAAIGAGRALALQSDGKILALAERGLARFEPDGTLDETFGTDGVVGQLFLGVTGDAPRDITVQRDGRILVVGYTRTSPASTNYDFAIRRLLEDGTNDHGFGTDGLVTIDFNGEVDRALRVIVLPDDSILVGGHAGSRSSQNELRNSFAVARLTSAGVLDRSLAGDGTVTSIGGSSFAYGLAVDPSGKILLGGSRADDGAAEKDAAMVRFHPDGAPDTNNDRDEEIWFGADGSGVGIDDIAGDDDSIQDLLVDEEGRIWGVVQSLSGGKYDFMFGQFSEHFGNVTGQGARFQQFVARMGPGNDLGQALARTPAGEFLVAGSASSAATAYDFGIARFTATAGLDTTFGDGGKVTIDFFGADDGANDLIVQPDGRIIALGVVRNGTSVEFGMVRVLP